MMYLSLKTIFLLGAALAAAVPTTNDATSDATLSQEIDASGSYISPDGLTQGGPRKGDIMKIGHKLDDHTHILISNLGGGGVQWNVNVGHPTEQCLGRKPAVDPTTNDATSAATLEARGLTQGGPSDEDVGKVTEKLDEGTHIVLFKGHRGQPVFRVNQGIPNTGCFMGKNPDPGWGGMPPDRS